MRLYQLIAVVAMVAVLAGCGGSGPNAPPFAPPGETDAIEVGPMVVRPASTAGFTAQPLDLGGRCAFVALSGARIDYLASRALLDRIVFASNRDGYYDIWVCNMDGSNLVQITNNGAEDSHPQWSHDGTRIVFHRQWPSSDSEIMTMNADGSTIRSLTNNSDDDMFPCWSPDSRKIAFQSDRTGNWEIFWMFADGSYPTNITNHAAADAQPDWSPNLDEPYLLFTSDRAGDYEIFRMGADGSDLQALTSNSDTDYFPAWGPRGYYWAHVRSIGGDFEIFIGSEWSDPYNFSNSPGTDTLPSWSSDGNWIAFTSVRSGNPDIWLQQTDEPFHAFQVTFDSAIDVCPHLGAPTMQTERVLIGPPGSDWGGLDPIWSSAYAGIVAYNEDGYCNFVRIGVSAADVGSLQLSPLLSPAQPPARPVGVLVEANRIINLREDAGRGMEPTVWNLDAFDAGAVILYFSDYSGKLISALVVQDTAYAAAADAPPAVQQHGEGEAVVAEGRFTAVFDAAGRNIAPDGAACVRIASSGELQVLR